MSKPSTSAELREKTVRAFRAHLHTVITARQFGQSKLLPALPGPKTADYCASLAELPDNVLAGQLAAPVCAVLKEIDNATMAFHRPLYQKAIEDPAKVAEYEKIVWQLDFALALIMRQFGGMLRFRAKRTKCSDLLCEVICNMDKGAEAADLVRRHQKEFPEEEDLKAEGSITDGGFPHDFAWDTYQRVEALDRLADEYPEHVRIAARRMHGWPMLVHRYSKNEKRFEELADRLELGSEYPLDATSGARFRPDTPLVRYLDPLLYRLNYVHSIVTHPEHKPAKSEAEDLRFWLDDAQGFPDDRPNDDEVEAAGQMKQLPRLTKATAGKWAEKVVVPYIMATDARDWKNCAEPALQRIARQKGVKSRATFKSRLLSAVSVTLRRLARPA